jgi:dipeptidyl aminopeptidase/acylaminoacyl peptidase
MPAIPLQPVCLENGLDHTVGEVVQIRTPPIVLGNIKPDAFSGLMASLVCELSAPLYVTIRVGIKDASAGRDPDTGWHLRRALHDPRHLPRRIGIPPSPSACERAPVRRSYCRRFGATLQDVSSTGSDGSHLQGWFARPEKASGDSVILLHEVGDNRQGMMGFAEVFPSNGFAVLLADSRAQGESGGDFPTYGLQESDDVHDWFDSLAMQEHPKCIFGLGESMGAAVLLQSVEKERRFCAVVAEHRSPASARLHTCEWVSFFTREHGWAESFFAQQWKWHFFTGV